MRNRSKLVYFISSAIIGIIAVIVVVATLILSGVLDVGSKKLVFSSASKEVFYDGQVLTCNEWTLVDGELEDGHTANVSVIGAQSSAGKSENTFFVSILDEVGNDVTAEYEIEKVAGELSVVALPLTVTTKGYQKVYDGIALEGVETDAWISSVNQPLEGHTYKFSVSGSQLDAGTSSNTAELRIYDATGKDVTPNYAITYTLGELKVQKRPLWIKSNDDGKDFDGTPLTCPIAEISATYPLVEGHEAIVDVTGSQTMVGESENTISAVKVVEHLGNGDTRDVTFNYEIHKQNGKLSIFGEPSGEQNEPEQGSDMDGDFFDEMAGNIGMDGADSALGGGADDYDLETVVARVYTDVSDTVYLRMKSDGDYTGQGWLPAVAYDALLDDKYSMNYLTGIVLEENGYERSIMKIDVVDKSYNIYMLPYYLDNAELIYNVQTNDAYYSGTVAQEYTVPYYLYGHQKSREGIQALLPAGYTADEMAYRQFVYANYKNVPYETEVYLKGIIKEQGWDKNTKLLVSEVAKFIQEQCKYNMEYDTTLDAQNDVVVAFLRDYQEGVCRHYAAAATMLYRTLGIPARYTEGFMVQTQAEEYVDVKLKNAHAWVEIYLDGIGWVQIEVTGSANSGGSGNGTGGGGAGGGSGAGGGAGGGVGGGAGGVTEFTVSMRNAYHEYDGFSLEASKLNVRLDSNLQKMITQNNYKWEVVLSGSQTLVGISESKIEAFYLYDEAGNDITEQYTFNFAPGKLHVYYYELTIETETIEKMYDGVALENSDKAYTISLPDDYNAELIGHTIVVTFTGSQLGVGKTSNKVTVEIFNENNEDVSVEYHIIKQTGVLEVLPVPIKFASDSAEAEYTGEALTCNSCKIVDSGLEEGGLLEGHTYVSTFTKSQTEVGRCQNRFTVTIYNENGDDVSSNYYIEYAYGVLRVVAPTEE